MRRYDPWKLAGAAIILGIWALIALAVLLAVR
jgi:hypothetical protein